MARTPSVKLARRPPSSRASRVRVPTSKPAPSTLRAPCPPASRRPGPLCARRLASFPAPPTARPACTPSAPPQNRLRHRACDRDAAPNGSGHAAPSRARARNGSGHTDHLPSRRPEWSRHADRTRAVARNGSRHAGDVRAGARNGSDRPPNPLPAPRTPPSTVSRPLRGIFWSASTLAGELADKWSDRSNQNLTQARMTVRSATSSSRWIRAPRRSRPRTDTNSPLRCASPAFW